MGVQPVYADWVAEGVTLQFESVPTDPGDPEVAARVETEVRLLREVPAFLAHYGIHVKP